MVTIFLIYLSKLRNLKIYQEEKIRVLYQENSIYLQRADIFLKCKLPTSIKVTL